MGEFVNSRLIQVIAWGGAALICILNAKLLWDLAHGSLGH
jgi:Mn2+/Fe2+ NRAMP family transporter